MASLDPGATGQPGVLVGAANSQPGASAKVRLSKEPVPGVDGARVVTGWHRVRHRESGEESWVASLAGVDPLLWEAAKVTRPPDEDDDYDWEGRRLTRNAARRAARLARAERLAAMPHARLVEVVMALEARMAAVEAKLAVAP